MRKATTSSKCRIATRLMSLRSSPFFWSGLLAVNYLIETMAKLKLYVENYMAGDHKLGELNLLFTFQVNCPGCFSYGFPLMELLREKYHDRISFLALSTAFEDYEFNNVENTELLVQEGQLVGETKKMFGEQLPYPIKIPVAMDQVAGSNVDLESLAEEMCHAISDFSIRSNSDKNEMHVRIKNYLLSQERISLTFSVNLFQGTPTFVLFDNSYEILFSWFGHRPKEQIENTIDEYIRKYS
ncbi:MAG: hypothetical protein RIC30_06685 [Marinoscillum sp.]|uniref:hypothetical protein n=1 Tax=Marinoscillum sp. TaxID=2024838 RepID=UPI003302CB07